MKKLDYQVSFNTPAFLGNANQTGQWRTPPFKALLRHWWRVAYAAHLPANVSVDAMRHAEGLLFGVASDDRGGSRKSQIRIRLDRWDSGKLRAWQPLAAVRHPEVRFPVGSDLYLAYGPLSLPRGARQPALKANAAIQAGETAKLSFAFPEEHGELIEQALLLTHHFGTLGGRSRNGWGSFDLKPASDTPSLINSALDPRLTKPWRDALTLDWPHAIGTDESGPLIWQTNETFNDWKTLMRRMAEIKIGLRTQFIFTTGNRAKHPEDRHWLSYPVTNHSVDGWNNARLPNSLRFKARTSAEGKLLGIIFHVPCLPPAQFRPNRRAIEPVWEHVHAFLDQPVQGLSRVPA